MILSRTYHSACARSRCSIHVWWIDSNLEKNLGEKSKKWGVFHYFTLSGVLSLSARASDERAQALPTNDFRLVPRVSGWVRAPVEQWSRCHFFLNSPCTNNNNSWVAVTGLEANHSDFAFQSRAVSPEVPAEKVRALLVAATPFLKIN